MPLSRQHARGYTLIELAMVLVIVGLITGGILVGSTLIRAAELQSIGKDFQRFEQAVNNFYASPYEAFPGDFGGAVAEWGGVTQNGNDNTFIVTFGAVNEPLRAWQHLSLADMVEGTYTGAAGSLPVSRIENGVFEFLGVPASHGGHSHYFAQNAGNYLVLWHRSVDALLTPEEAYVVDLKFDDELPGTGKITSNNNASGFGSCADGDDQLASRYSTTTTDVRCILIYRLRVE